LCPTPCARVLRQLKRRRLPFEEDTQLLQKRGIGNCFVYAHMGGKACIR
jgi:hypothetical protein